MGIPWHSDDLQGGFYPTFKPTFSGCHPGKLPDGQSVHNGNRGNAHKAFVTRYEHRAVNVVAVGVGTVKDHDGFTLFSGSFKHVKKGRNVGLKAGANILNVKDDNVYVGQVFGGRFFVFSVERFDG